MLWLGRLFDDRYALVRLTVMNLAAASYLTLVPQGAALDGLSLYLALGVIAFAYVGAWSPIVAVSGLAAALAVGSLLGADTIVPMVALGWAMLELGVRRSGRQVWCAAAIGLTGSLVADYGEVADVVLTVVFRAGAAVVLPLLFGMHVRVLAELNRQAAERAGQEADRVRAEERAAIARELHDLVAHHVASIVLRVGVARDVLEIGDPRVRQVLDDVHATGSGALSDLRRLVAVLRDPGSAQSTAFVDPEGLLVALRSAVERGQQLGLTVDAEIDPAVVRLDARTALAVLRLAQEGLANVAGHAGTAARACLSIQVNAEQLTFDLQDFGGRAATSSTGGHGLVGLRERVEVLGGSLHAGPTDVGWRLTALVPTMGELA
ncbi:histidine kinase [Kribbella sp. NPDC003557]|uniref:sensor histidine kinase n=1 Tax=Kribbella sp. NPDC003557 TaxID=3154449 RepID=UPI0033AC694E